MKVGDQVSWVDAVGNKRFGTIDSIASSGRVFVASAVTNHKGRPRTRIATCWFDPHELDRLTVKS